MGSNLKNKVGGAITYCRQCGKTTRLIKVRHVKEHIIIPVDVDEIDIHVDIGFVSDNLESGVFKLCRGYRHHECGG